MSINQNGLRDENVKLQAENAALRAKVAGLVDTCEKFPGRSCDEYCWNSWVNEFAAAIRAAKEGSPPCYPEATTAGELRKRWKPAPPYVCDAMQEAIRAHDESEEGTVPHGG